MSTNKRPSLLNMVQSERDRKRLDMAATVTEEAEWHREESNGGLARMFVVMLLIHIVVIGGIIVYDFFGDPNKGKLAAATPGTPKTAVSSTPNAAPTVTVAKPVVATPVPMSLSAAMPSVPSTPVSQVNDNAPVVVKPPVQVAAMNPPQAISLSEESLLPPEEQKPSVQAKPSVPVEKTLATSSIVEKVTARPATVAAKVEERQEVSPTPIMTPREAERLLHDEDKRSASVSSAKSKTVMHVKESPPKKVESKKSTSTTVKSSPFSSSKSTSSTKKPATVAKKPAAKTSRGHTVSKGETVYALAKKYGVSEKQLMAANGIKSAASLRVGKALVIPTK
jgi:LysM repeat protein